MTAAYTHEDLGHGSTHDEFHICCQVLVVYRFRPLSETLNNTGFLLGDLGNEMMHIL